MITDDTEKKPLMMSISASLRINTGNYGHADVFLSISNVTKDTTPEEMEETMDAGKVAYGLLTKRLRTEAAKIKQDGGV